MTEFIGVSSLADEIGTSASNISRAVKEERLVPDAWVVGPKGKRPLFLTSRIDEVKSIGIPTNRQVKKGAKPLVGETTEAHTGGIMGRLFGRS
jgi:hypothetical protein